MGETAPETQPQPAETPDAAPQPTPAVTPTPTPSAAGASPAAAASPQVAPSSGLVPSAERGQDVGTVGAIIPSVDKLTRPELDSCPSCKIGLLHVITWDDDAVHENDQPIFAPAMLSGGAAQRKCFHCDYGDSVALNPQPAPAKPPWVQ